ncbi:hypothetical protein V2G26_014742 [Clonostachys chloroleuca]|uniref:2-iminobutanoate/2-iminopropanoate deaminase n=2 Tax=Clonostachys TaxID=110564 RepID=A0A9N9YED3_9HYPO|nr:unnamed protein product [Clonostachys rhizophaga]CAI6092369.1 unnamed protein product [Clonostachys chloroleuca]
MSAQNISTNNAAPAVGPYSQGVAVPASASLIFTSGQLPAEQSGNIDLSQPVGVLTERCITNIKGILEASNSGIEKVIKATVFLTSMDSFGEVNQVYEKHFSHKPARSCVAVKELPKGVPVEIEVIALA